jgi:beta-glucosidase/6-phospho-beta-glucosidase/beta-galactosidase
MRDGLTIQDIGAISIHAKYIVAVFSGPITACFNEYSKDNVKKWIILNNMQYTLKFMYINNTVTDNIESVYDIIEQSQ